MYQEFYSHSTLLHLPLIAMALFMGAFVAVLWRVLCRRRTESRAQDDSLSHLPLRDDEPTPAPPEGGRHG